MSTSIGLRNPEYNNPELVKQQQNPLSLPAGVRTAYSVYTSCFQQESANNRITPSALMLTDAPQQKDYSAHTATGIATVEIPGGKGNIFVAARINTSDPTIGKPKGKQSSNTGIAFGVTSTPTSELIMQEIPEDLAPLVEDKSQTADKKACHDKPNTNKEKDEKSTIAKVVDSLKGTKLTNWTVKGFYCDTSETRETTNGEMTTASRQYGVEASVGTMTSFSPDTRLSTSLTLRGANSQDTSEMNGQEMSSQDTAYSANGNINLTHSLIKPDPKNNFSMDYTGSANGSWSQTSQCSTTSSAISTGLNLSYSNNTEGLNCNVSPKIYRETRENATPFFSSSQTNSGVELGANISYTPDSNLTITGNVSFRRQQVSNSNSGNTLSYEAHSGFGYNAGLKVLYQTPDKKGFVAIFNASRNTGGGTYEEMEVSAFAPVSESTIVSVGGIVQHSDGKLKAVPFVGAGYIPSPENGCIRVDTGLDEKGGYLGRISWECEF